MERICKQKGKLGNTDCLEKESKVSNENHGGTKNSKERQNRWEKDGHLRAEEERLSLKRKKKKGSDSNKEGVAGPRTPLRLTTAGIKGQKFAQKAKSLLKEKMQRKEREEREISRTSSS